MSLEIQRGKSRWWYGRIKVNGRTVYRNLGIEVAGEIPDSLRELGDIVFERSRTQAHLVLEQLRRDLKKGMSSEKLIQLLHEARTGEQVPSILLADMCGEWKALPRRRPVKPKYMAQSQTIIERFVQFLRARHPMAREMADVQTRMVTEFMAAESSRGVTATTYNSTLILLRSCFQRLRFDAGLAQNPFEGIPTKEASPILREAFDESEISAILDKAKEDPLIRPIIITAVCTAMRKGDCCLLRWESVDLDERFISVKTSKTGAVISIPIFPLLYEVLVVIDGPRAGYVFPEQAAIYNQRPDAITHRTKLVLRKAGLFDEDDAMTESLGELQQARSNGLRRASVRDFHSFRVTWVTMALNAGVPIELVRKVTGHQTVEIVTKHYYRPGLEELRREMTEKLPRLITGAPPPQRRITITEIRTKLKAMTKENWETLRDELIALIDSILPEIEAPKIR